MKRINIVLLILALLISLTLCLMAFGQSRPTSALTPHPSDLSDTALLELTEKTTFKYFWDFAHPVSGLARERSNITDYGPEVVTIGGSGFGIMAIIVGAERKWI